MRTVICAGNDEEEAILAAEGRGPWNPWVWSRVPRGQLASVGEEVDDLRLGWAVWFQALDAGAPAPPSQSVPIPTAEPPEGAPQGARDGAVQRLRVPSCRRGALGHRHLGRGDRVGPRLSSAGNPYPTGRLYVSGEAQRP